MNAKLVIITGRKRSARPRSQRRRSTCPGALLLGELDDQDGVLGRERDQHDEPDLAVEVEAQPARRPRRSRPSTPTLTESSTGIGMFQLSYSATRNR